MFFLQTYKWYRVHDGISSIKKLSVFCIPQAGGGWVMGSSYTSDRDARRKFWKKTSRKSTIPESIWEALLDTGSFLFLIVTRQIFLINFLKTSSCSFAANLKKNRNKYASGTITCGKFEIKSDIETLFPLLKGTTSWASSSVPYREFPPPLVKAVRIQNDLK